MIERWTIDVVANEIGVGLRDATPSPRLLRRFYRHGYRHGRKAISARTARAMIIGAVDVASSAIAQEYVATRDDLRSQQATMNGRLTSLAATIDAESTPIGTSAALQSEATPGASDLPGNALLVYKERQAQAALRVRQQKVEALGQQVREAQMSHELLTEQTREAPGRFLQRLESCHDAGRLLWARYCQGFVKGASKRGNPDDEDEMSDPAIRFDVPLSLALAQDIPGLAAPTTTI